MFGFVLTQLWWANTLTILVSAGSIFFFLRKTLVKSVAADVRELNKKVSPNGKNTQNIGDIAARTEEKLDSVVKTLEVLGADSKRTKEMLIEHLGWHKGQQDTLHLDNVTSSK